MDQAASPSQTILGRTENAVRIQIHVAIITYCLIAIIEYDFKIGRPIIEVMRILNKSVLTTDSIQELLQPFKQKEGEPNNGQLCFEFETDCHILRDTSDCLLNLLPSYMKFKSFRTLFYKFLGIFYY